MQCVIITYKEENLIEHKWETVPTITKLGQPGKTDTHTHRHTLWFKHTPTLYFITVGKGGGVLYYIMLEKWGG